MNAKGDVGVSMFVEAIRRRWGFLEVQIRFMVMEMGCMQSRSALFEMPEPCPYKVGESFHGYLRLSHDDQKRRGMIPPSGEEE
jgi:hypothetical protein